MSRNIFLFHCTGGNPDIYWFAWIKKKLLAQGHDVYAIQFPSPVNEPSCLNEWLKVFAPYQDKVNEQSVLIGHSLGGVFALILLEGLTTKIYLTTIVASYIGIGPVQNCDELIFNAFYYLEI